MANVPSFPELRGKTVEVSRIGDSSHYLAVAGLNRFGLRGDEVDFLNVGPIPERLAALLSRQVDATVVIVPSNLQAVKAGMYQLADLGDLGIPYIGTSIYMRRSVADQNRVATEGFLKGLMQGNRAVPTQPERATAVLQKYLNLEDPELLEASDLDTVQGTEPVLMPSMAGLEDLIAQTVQQNPGIRGIRPEQFVDLRLIPAIEASGFVRELEQQQQDGGGSTVRNNPMGIRGLDHFSIPVSDTRRSLTFYEAIFGATVYQDEIGRYEFGFSEEDKRLGRSEHIFVEIAGQRVELLGGVDQLELSSLPTGPKTGESFSPGRGTAAARAAPQWPAPLVASG